MIIDGHKVQTLTRTLKNLHQMRVCFCFLFYFGTPTEQNSWIHQFNQFIQVLKAASSIILPPPCLSESILVWVQMFVNVLLPSRCSSATLLWSMFVLKSLSDCRVMTSDLNGVVFCFVQDLLDKSSLGSRTFLVSFFKESSLLLVLWSPNTLK